MKQGKLGVIGGMGPQAGLLFCQRVLDCTAAHSDQEHIPTLIVSDTEMPDRTAALLSGETAPVRDRLLADARALEGWGATAIAITCNTAHAFLPFFEKELTVPVVNMITETAAALKAMGARQVGIMATDGTIKMGLYHAALAQQGLEAVSPGPKEQRLVMSLIYDEIKSGLRGSEEKFAAVVSALKAVGCEHIVLACTELSAYKDWHPVDEVCVDAMDVLARRCVELCGYPLRSC